MLGNQPPSDPQLRSNSGVDRTKEYLERQGLADTHPAIIYRFLQEKSPERSLQLLPLLTDEQFIRLIDYDIWRKDRLSPVAAIGWLIIYRQISRAEMVKRFRSLDEEYQLAIIAPLLTLTTTEELEKLPVTEQDCYINLPCQQLCYRVVAGLPQDIQEFLPTFIDATLDQDINYTYSLLQHAHYSLPSEQEALIAQFRNARVAEDGYCSTADAMIVFKAVELEEYLQRWHSAASPEVAVQTWRQGNFLDQVISQCHNNNSINGAQWQEIQLQIIVCANKLCAATYVEINDSVATRKSLEQTKNLIALALDYLSCNDPDYASQIIIDEQAQTLLRIGMTLCLRLQKPMLDTMRRCKLPKINKLTALHETHKWQALAELIDVEYLDLLGITNIELLKSTLSYSPTVVIAGKLEDVHCMFNYQQLAAQTAVLADIILLAYWHGKPQTEIYTGIRKQWADAEHKIDVALLEAHLSQGRQEFYRSFPTQETINFIQQEMKYDQDNEV